MINGKPFDPIHLHVTDQYNNQCDANGQVRASIISDVDNADTQNCPQLEGRTHVDLRSGKAVFSELKLGVEGKKSGRYLLKFELVHGKSASIAPKLIEFFYQNSKLHISFSSFFMIETIYP